MRTPSCWRSGSPFRQHVRSDEGMVIAEAAIAIPVLTAVALGLVWALSLVGTTLTLADAARQVARDVARGVAVHESVGSAQERAPDAVITVESAGDEVLVVVRQDAVAPIPLLSGITIPLRQAVAVPREWT